MKQPIPTYNQLKTRTGEKHANAIYTAKRNGLNQSQYDIVCAMDQWEMQHPERGPSTTDLTKMTGYSIGTIYWSMPVLIELGIVSATFDAEGNRRPRSVRLCLNPEDVRVKPFVDRERLANADD